MTGRSGPSGNDCLEDRVAAQLAEAEAKAIDALARYKFQMFGYWAAIWVHLNMLEGKRQPSPFRDLVKLARAIREKGEEKNEDL